MNTALLIIDVQRGLCEGPYAAHEASALVSRLAALARRARRQRIPVIWVQHLATDPSDLLHPSQPGSALAQDLGVQSQDHIITKTSSDAFHHTALSSTLENAGIKQLVIGGLQTEYCVDTSVRRALALGYSLTLLADGHSTLANPILSAPQIIAHHNLTLSQLDSFAARASLRECVTVF